MLLPTKLDDPGQIARIIQEHDHRFVVHYGAYFRLCLRPISAKHHPRSNHPALAMNSPRLVTLDRKQIDPGFRFHDRAIPLSAYCGSSAPTIFFKVDYDLFIGKSF